MGILDGLFSGTGGMSDPVPGVAQVISASAHRGRGVYQNCRMQLVVSADGVPATPVEVHEIVHNQRWPMPGTALPVTVDRANPSNVKVHWDQVQSSRDRAAAQAEAIAAQMRAEAAQQPPPPAPAPPPAASAPDPDDALADRLAKLAQLHASGALTDAEFAAAKAKLLD